MLTKWTSLTIIGLALCPISTVFADEAPLEFALTIKDHRWEPAELHVPSGKKFQIKIQNLDATAEEFDSPPLKAEKIITGNGQSTVRVHALEPGKYSFMGEYHADTAQGVVIAE
jgi:plastocyanin